MARPNRLDFLREVFFTATDFKVRQRAFDLVVEIMKRRLAKAPYPFPPGWAEKWEAKHAVG